MIPQHAFLNYYSDLYPTGMDVDLYDTEQQLWENVNYRRPTCAWFTHGIYPHECVNDVDQDCPCVEIIT